MEKVETDLIEEMVSRAAKAAGIEREKSYECIRSALATIKEITLLHGGMDLSSFGLPGLHSCPVGQARGAMH